MSQFKAGISTLTIQNLVEICEKDLSVELSKDAVQKVEKSADHVDQIIKSGNVTYGINTGFGPFAVPLFQKKILQNCRIIFFEVTV